MTHDWSRRWQFTLRPTFDFMTQHIMERMLYHIPADVGSSLELGCGTGRLSLLLAHARGCYPTLVDKCPVAVALATGLFRQYGTFSQVLVDDVDDREAMQGYAKRDVVFSSGLIEHYQGAEARKQILLTHIHLAQWRVLLVHPTDTLWARLFNASWPARWLYGYQKAFTEEEINGYLRDRKEVRCVTHERFHPFYTVPGLHNCEWLNRMGEVFGWGGLTLTTIEVEPWYCDDNFSHP